MTLSVVIATFNEENFIGQCLDSIKDLADEIIVVDGTSNDQTVAIAKKYGARIKVVHNNPLNFHINKKIAIDMATKDWILQLDADEVVSPKLSEEISEVLKSNSKINGYWIPRSNYFLGRFLKKGGVYPDYTVRLYRRGKGNLPAKDVHEQAKIEGEAGYLKSDLLHYSNRTFSDYIQKRFLRYSQIMAVDLKGGLIENFFIQPLFNRNQGFISIYLRHLGILDGFPGFVWALFSSLHFPMAYLFKREKDYACRVS